MQTEPHAPSTRPREDVHVGGPVSAEEQSGRNGTQLMLGASAPFFID